MLDRLTFDDFAPLQQSCFIIKFLNGATTDLRLVSVVKVMESEAPRLKRDPFSLLFVGPPEPALQQDTYCMRHERFPQPLEIFIVPIGRHPDGFLYEAVFT